MIIERAEKILSYQLESIKAADSKVPPLFAINITMLGVIVALTKTQVCWSPFLIVIALFTCLLLLTSIATLALAMFPRLDGPKASNIYFDSIRKKTQVEFMAEVKSLTTEDYQDDTLSQSHRNAEIAREKFMFVKASYIATFLSVPVWLIAIYLLYT